MEQFREKKLVMNRLGKTVELIVKLENTFDEEGKMSNVLNSEINLKQEDLKQQEIMNY